MGLMYISPVADHGGGCRVLVDADLAGQSD